MRTDRVSPRPSIVQFFADVWSNWYRRRTRLAEFDSTDLAEAQRIARELGTSVSELRILVGRGENAADLLRRRLQSLNIDPAAIEPAVMRDMRRCCSLCGDKTLCVHELEDRPKAASWPRYCPNEQTIGALVDEKFEPKSAPIT